MLSFFRIVKRNKWISENSVAFFFNFQNSFKWFEWNLRCKILTTGTFKLYLLLHFCISEIFQTNAMKLLTLLLASCLLLSVICNREVEARSSVKIRHYSSKVKRFYNRYMKNLVFRLKKKTTGNKPRKSLFFTQHVLLRWKRLVFVLVTTADELIFVLQNHFL